VDIGRIYDIHVPPDGELTTEAGIVVDRCYGPESLDPERIGEIGAPGEFPFTRGNHPGGYRDRLWTFRQYSGFGTAEWSNERYKLLLKEGGTGLSVAADLPTQIGYDSDDPEVEEEVGRVGVALDSLADAEILFRDIPLDAISTSWTVNGTAAIMLAFYVAVGGKQGVPRERHPEGVRVTRHVDLAPDAVDPPDRRLDRVLCGGGAALQRSVGCRRPFP
jgi:methylmalonyl-CoA mutase N-terminal domain/subunit